jgi:hypothetical protein
MSKQVHTYENAPYVGQTSLTVRNITLDSLKLESIVTSYLGNVHIYDDAFYYVDRKFCYVYKFDKNGKLLNRYAGVGNNPNEMPIKTIVFSTFLPNGNSIFMGPSWDCYIFDKDFKRINDYSINWHFDVSKEELLKRPDPSNTRMYSLAYGVSKIKATNNELYFPIASQHPDFNPVNRSYATQARTMGKMRIDNGYVDAIFGSFPPTYRKNTDKLIMPYMLFDLKDDNHMYFTFPADSLIYLADDESAISASFGTQGRNMDTNYVNADNLKSFSLHARKQKEERGHYTSLTYIKEKGLLFRSYHKNGNDSTEGLQIYKDQTLIGDVDVPAGFEVNGYISPWIYSREIINEETGEIRIYKFQLD